MSVCSTCNKPFNGQLIINCLICNNYFHATTACTGATASEVKVFELKQTKPVLSYRCIDCRQKNTPLSVQETLSDLDNKFSKFISNYEDLLSKVLEIKKEVDCIPEIKRNVDYLKSDFFNEKLISESMLRMSKSKNVVLYDVPEKGNQSEDMAFIESIFGDTNIPLEGINAIVVIHREMELLSRLLLYFRMLTWLDHFF